MTTKPTLSIIHHFSSIDNPRVNRQKKHQLQDIFFISICAIICGADNWVAVEEFGIAKEEWFTELLGLEHGIPSHDTFGEVYAAIKTEKTSKVGVKIKRLKAGWDNDYLLRILGVI